MPYQSAGALAVLDNTTPALASVQMPANAAGDFLIFRWNSYVGDSTMTGPVAAGFTGPIGTERSSGGQSDMLLYWKISSGSEPATIPISNTGQASSLNSGEARIYNYGQATLEDFDGWTGSGASNTIQLATLTSGGANRRRVDVYGRFGASVAANPFTHTAGSTPRENSFCGMSDMPITAPGDDAGRTCTATDGSGWLQSVSLLLIEAPPNAAFSGAITADDAAAAGSFQSSSSSFAGTITADNAAAAGSFSNVPGAIVTGILKNNAGLVLANISGWAVNVWNPSTGDKVGQITGLTTDGAGRLTISSALLAPGTSYVYEPVHATHGRHLPVAVAA